jgi:mycofactocin system glycosyltransferase
VTRYVLDAETRRLGESRVVLGGSPRRLFRLSPAGITRFDAIAAGGNVNTNPLAERLLAAGAIHPVTRQAPERLAATTVVIPVHDADPAALAKLVASLPAVAGVVVVDDASRPSVRTVAGADVVRREHNGGPAAARNTGRLCVATEFVAFVDADVLTGVDPSWLVKLLGHFDDDRVGLVAPRVAGLPGAGLLGAYEAGHGALDLGDRPGLVGIGSNVSYVPAAAIVVRRSALDDIDGFDERMRVGEDVDMLWRLVAAGSCCRYEPAATVHHRSRGTWRAWARQRFAYGRSAAQLAARHRHALPAIRISPWSAGVLALTAMGALRTATCVVFTTSALLAWRIHRAGVPMSSAALAAAQLSGGGHLQAARQVASALRRPWWPAALAASMVSRRARLITTAALTASVLDSRQRRWAPVRVLDDLFYGAGVWFGVVRHRQVAPLLPSYRQAS